jgi:hypothetical protein
LRLSEVARQVVNSDLADDVVATRGRQTPTAQLTMPWERLCSGRRSPREAALISTRLGATRRTYALGPENLRASAERRRPVPYVITDARVDIMERSCVEQCPVACIDCIDCGASVTDEHRGTFPATSAWSPAG